MEKNFKAFLMTFVMLMSLLSLMPQTAFDTYAATTTDFAAQLVRITTADGNRNINVSGLSDGSALNTWITNGVQNENWRFDYVTTNVFRIVNMGTGMVLSVSNGSTATNTSCIIEGNTNTTYQYWYVTPVSQDALGNDLYYKITNYADTSKALTYNATSNTITLTNYTGASNQKFLLNTAGLQGFAGYGKDTSGNTKASTIGGLLGETVYVSTFSELKTALSDDIPRTVVVTANMSYSGSSTTDNEGRKKVSTKIYIGNHKTLIGSYNANTLHNIYLGTYYSGNDIIIKNITATHDGSYNSDNLWEFANGNNLWLDHISFIGHSTINTASVGGDIDKFIAIKGESNYSTISDCSFGKHEYGLLFGYPADTDAILTSYKGKPCISMITNYFDGCVTRAPGLMRYGYFHTLNNYVTNFDLGYTMHTAATIYAEKNYYNGGTGKGSVVNDNALGLTQITNASVNKVGPWYTDSGSLATNCYSNNNVANINSLTTAWHPSTNYSYKTLSAYDSPNYCTKNSGVKDTRAAMTYMTFATTGVPSANYLVVKNTSSGAQMPENKSYMLKNANSGLYLEVENGRAINGTNVQQWGANGSAAHNTWRFVSAGGGYYYIYSALGDGVTYLLDVNNNSATNGTNIQIYQNTNCDAQKYKFKLNSDGTYTIYTKASKDQSCVEVKNALTTSGSNVQQWEINGHPCQNWILEAVN